MPFQLKKALFEFFECRRHEEREISCTFREISKRLVLEAWPSLPSKRRREDRMALRLMAKLTRPSLLNQAEKARFSDFGK